MISRREIDRIIWELSIPEIESLLVELVNAYGHIDVLRELLKISYNHPAFFAKTLLKHPLFDYQIEFMESIPKHKRIVINAGRQVGKSTVVALAILWMLVVRHKMKRKIESSIVTEPALYISVAPSYQQAQIIFHKILNILNERREFKDLFIAKIKRSSSREEIDSVFGSRYISRSVKGKSGSDILRGFTSAGVVIDESAFIPDLEDIIHNVLEPMLSTTNGWLILISSPNREDDYFYRAFRGDVPGWKSFHWTTDMNPLARDFFERKRRELGDDHPAFRREYLAIPSDVGAYVFRPSLLREALRPRALESYDAYGAGLDIGLSEDRSALVVVGVNTAKGMAEVIEVHVYPRGAPIDEVIAHAVEVVKNYRNEKLTFAYFDATVIGDQLTQLFPQINEIFMPFKITAPKRMMLIATVKAIVESGKLAIPPEFKILYDEMYRLTFVKRGTTIRPDHPKGAHDDTVMALALALQALVDYGFTPLATGEIEKAKSELDEQIRKMTTKGVIRR